MQVNFFFNVKLTFYYTLKLDLMFILNVLKFYKKLFSIISSVFMFLYVWIGFLVDLVLKLEGTLAGTYSAFIHRPLLEGLGV